MDALPPGGSARSDRSTSRQPRRRWIRRIAAGTAVAAVVASTTSSSGTAGACDELTIPSLSLDRCVVAGDQTLIDAGYVVRVDVLSSERVHWLAGHRTSHGGTFRSLTGVELGADLTFRGVSYRVVEYLLVDRTAPSPVAGWVTADSPTLVLQTSAHGSMVHVWRSVPSGPEVTPPGSSAAADSGAASVSVRARRAGANRTEPVGGLGVEPVVHAVRSAAPVATPAERRARGPVEQAAAVVTGVLARLDATSTRWR